MDSRSGITFSCHLERAPYAQTSWSPVEAGEGTSLRMVRWRLQLARYKICEDSPMIGQTLTQLAFRELSYGTATSCRFSTPEEVIDMPGGHSPFRKGFYCWWSVLILNSNCSTPPSIIQMSVWRPGGRTYHDARIYAAWRSTIKKNVSSVFFIKSTLSTSTRSILGKSLKDNQYPWWLAPPCHRPERGSYTTMTNPMFRLCWKRRPAFGS